MSLKSCLSFEEQGAKVCRSGTKFSPQLDPKTRPLFGPKFGTFCLFLYKEGPIFGDQNVTLFLGPKIGLVFGPLLHQVSFFLQWIQWLMTLPLKYLPKDS